MIHHQLPERQATESSRWWVFAAWASLGLLLGGGLAAAAGLG